MIIHKHNLEGSYFKKIGITCHKKISLVVKLVNSSSSPGFFKLADSWYGWGEDIQIWIVLPTSTFVKLNKENAKQVTKKKWSSEIYRWWKYHWYIYICALFSLHNNVRGNKKRKKNACWIKCIMPVSKKIFLGKVWGDLPNWNCWSRILRVASSFITGSLFRFLFYKPFLNKVVIMVNEYNASYNLLYNKYRMEETETET